MQKSGGEASKDRKAEFQIEILFNIAWEELLHPFISFFIWCFERVNGYYPEADCQKGTLISNERFSFNEDS